MIALFRQLSWFWKLGVFAVLVFSLIFTFKALFVTPAVNKAVVPLNNIILELKADTANVNEALRLQIKDNLRLSDSLVKDKAFHDSQIKKMQQLIQSITAQHKAKENTTAAQIAELEKGLPPKQCYRVVFGKMKQIECPE